MTTTPINVLEASSHYVPIITSVVCFLEKKGRKNIMTKPNNAPPIVIRDYKPRGQYTTIGGLKTCSLPPSRLATPTNPTPTDHTSGPSPRASILFIYDVFGFIPPTLQGADILAQTGNFSVYMPDWLTGHYADRSWFPTDTPEKAESIKTLFMSHGDVGVAGARVGSWMQSMRGDAKWGIAGLCWGGKVTSIVTGFGGADAGGFSCAAIAHPLMLDPGDAEDISIPFLLLASKDEDAEDVRQFGEVLKGKKVVETFADQIHGWMGGGADLEDRRCREEYERGYGMLVEFFGENL
jgi:dienelactone hydrolase